jgi:ribosomal-protein-alanine N-acetyltransferase
MKTLVMEPVIRPMVQEDLGGVVALDKDTCSCAWSREHFLREMMNPCAHALVLHCEHRLLGYMVFWMICDEVHLLKLVVHPEFQGSGLGKRLMAFLIQFVCSHGVKWVGLEVRRSNQAALALYRSLGFEERRVRKGYYRDTSEDGIVMEWELNREPS